MKKHDGEKITLYHNFRKKQTDFSSTGIHATFYCNYLIIGGHYLEPNELSFSKLIVGIKNLQEWLNIAGFNDIVDRSNKKLLIEYKLPEDLIFKIDDNMFGKLNFSYSFSPEIFENKIRQEVHFEINTENKIHFEQFFKLIYYYIYFFTFAAYEISYPTIFYCFHKNSGSGLEPDCTILSKNLSIKEEPQHPNKFLFTYNDVKDLAPNIFQKWFSVREKLEPIIFILADSFIKREIVTEVFFLNIARAIESFHRRFKKNERNSSEEYNDKVQKVLSCLRETDLFAFAKEIFDYKNEPSPDQRLRELIDLIPITLQQKILHPFSAEEIVQKTSFNRNYYTHFDSKKKAKALKNVELYKLSIILRSILIISILFELEIRNKKLEEVITRNASKLFYN